MRPDDVSMPADAADAPPAASPDPHATGQAAGPVPGEEQDGGDGRASGGGPRHAAPDDAGPRPLIDMSRDPHPGVPDHAAPDADDESAT